MAVFRRKISVGKFRFLETLVFSNKTLFKTYGVVILVAISGTQHLEEKPTGYCFIQMYMKNSYSYYGRSFISHTVFTKVFCLLQLLCKLWLMVPSSINFWGTLSQMYVFFVFLNLMNLAPHLYSFLQIGNGDALGLLLSCVFRVASGTWRKISATFPGLFPDVLVIFQEKWQQKFEKRLFTKP